VISCLLPSSPLYPFCPHPSPIITDSPNNRLSSPSSNKNRLIIFFSELEKREESIPQFSTFFFSQPKSIHNPKTGKSRKE